MVPLLASEVIFEKTSVSVGTLCTKNNQYYWVALFADDELLEMYKKESIEDFISFMEKFVDEVDGLEEKIQEFRSGKIDFEELRSFFVGNCEDCGHIPSLKEVEASNLLEDVLNYIGGPRIADIFGDYAFQLFWNPDERSFCGFWWFGGSEVYDEETLPIPYRGSFQKDSEEIETLIRALLSIAQHRGVYLLFAMW